MSVTDPSITVCFDVTLDGCDIGSFTSCEGLGMQIAIEKHEEGGNNGFVYQLPGRMSFSNIKLTRPIDSNSPVLAAWMTNHAYDIQNGSQRGAQTASIRACTADGTVVCVWQLDRVVPVSWTGPSFNVDGPKVATETLELAHHGFLKA